MISELRNKEFGIIELITRGWKAFKDNFISILIITLIINLPFDIFKAFLWSKNEQLYLLIQWVTLYFELPASMAVAVLVEHYILPANAYYPTSSIETAFSALKKAFSRFGDLLITSTLIGSLVFLFLVIFSILEILALPLLVIPSLIFIINQSFLLEAITLRKYRGQTALFYSKSIVQGRWWKVLFLLVILIINLYFIVVYLALLQNVFALINPTLKLFTKILFLFSVSLIVHFNQAVRTIFFLNLDYRKN